MSTVATPENSPVQGIRRDVRSDVQQICQLLNEYLEGFAFLKELIQNSDDAEATEILVAWHQGFGKMAPHALLQGPGLLIVNNGAFRDEHKRGICNLGLGTSGADAEKIGRFGLGIKSVFHVCEAFFFFESKANPNLRSLFSPWFDEFHTEWRSADGGWPAVWKCLQEECDRQTRRFKWQKWFALWIPLRRKEHCGAPGAIRQDADAFPGEHETCPESLVATFTQVTPRIEETLLLLKKLQRVHFHTGSNEKSYKRPDENGVERIRRYSKVVRGTVDVAAWQSLPKWPRVFSGRDDNVTGMVPDKAKWDASVTVTLSRDALATGRLRVFWNVYLPVGNTPALDLLIPGLDADIHLFLHGFFFLNRSRTEILGVHDGFDGANKDDERGIRLAWNRALATEAGGLFPLLIPALDECFRKEGLPERQVGYVTAALQNSALFQNQLNRDSICRRVRFGRYLVDGQWNWSTVESERDVLVLPACGIDPDEVEQLLAKLLLENGDSALVIEGSAELSNSPSKMDWTTEALHVFAAQVVERPFEQAERTYLRSVLVDARFPPDALQAWSDFAIFEIRSLSSGARRSASLREVQKFRAEDRIFASAHLELARELGRACPSVVAWLVETNLPPSVVLAPLDPERVASLVLRHENLGIASQRRELLSLLAGNVTSSEIRRAARYLLHGDADRRTDTTTCLLFKGGEWEVPVRLLSSYLGHEWACVDGLFSGELSEHEKASLSAMDCGADAFRKLCYVVDLTAIPAALAIGRHAEFLIGNLHGDPGDDGLLRRLPIHRYGPELFTSVEEGVWLAPQDEPITHNADLWRELKSRCRIVERYGNPLLAPKQAQIFEGRILDRDGVIRLCAIQADAPRFANLILECLSHRTPSREAADSLRQSSWLPLIDGGSCMMQQVIWIGGIEAEIERVLSALPVELGMVTRSKLAIDWDATWAAGGWRTMSNPATPLIPCGAKLVEALKSAIASCPATHLGIEITDPVAIRGWSRAVKGYERNFSPAALFVCRLAEDETRHDAATWLWDLCSLFFLRWNSSEAARFDDALEALRVRHGELAVEERQDVEEVFYAYLIAARDAGRWESTYRTDPDFLLLNARGKWTEISRLATDIPGISRSAVVHPLAAKALGLDAAKHHSGDADSTHDVVVAQDSELMRQMDEYAVALGTMLNRRHWGVFLALLGGNVRESAAHYLDGEDRIDGIRSDLAGPFRSPPKIKLLRARYRCEIHTQTELTLESIFGQPFSAPAESDPHSLLIPQPDPNGGNRCFVVCEAGDSPRYAFKLINPHVLGGLTRGRMRELLILTIQSLQRDVFAVVEDVVRKVPDLLDTIAELQHGGIGCAQQELLAGVRMQLTQMGYRAKPASALAAALAELEEAASLYAQAREERREGYGNPVATLNDATRREEKSVETVRALLEADYGLHGELVHAMAHRIQQEQYQADSIPFELFQNADDAYLDLGEASEASGVFVADFGEVEAHFAHAGRPINQASSADESTKKRQGRDLVKMLILHGSEKSRDDDVPHTGKFGLGFKSVFLVCRRPDVLSGELAFEIVGGFFPKRLPSERLSQLREWVAAHLPMPGKGTVIRLRKDVIAASFEVRFRELAAFLPIFAKAIREVRIVGGKTHSWNPQALHDGDGWFVRRGVIAFGGLDREVLLVSGRNVSWLFGSDGRRLVSLPDLPCLWITAPTMESVDLGFALNGPFEPDPGRTRLTSSEGGRLHNAALFAEAAHVLESFIRWQSSDERSRREFAESCWRLFGRPALHPESSDGRNALLNCLWEEGQGYRAVLDSENFLPNGLQGRLFRLTRLPAVRFMLVGFLDSKPGRSFLEALVEWDEWRLSDPQTRIQPDELLSAGVASALKLKCVFPNELSELTTVGVLTRLLGAEQHLKPGVAAKLGEFFTEQELFNASEEQNHYNWPDAEKERLRDWLGNVRFMNREGLWMGVEELVTVGGGPVETIRAAVAPASKRLNADYESQPGAVKLFQLCRGEMEVEAQELSAWLEQVADAPEGERTNGSLRFLASDDPLLSRVTNRLSSRTRIFFLSCNAFSALPVADQNRIRNAFHAGDLFGAQTEGRLFGFSGQAEDIDSQGPVADTIDVSEILRVWDPSDALGLFTLSGPLRGLVLLDADDDEALRDALSSQRAPHHRECWFRLLCLGCALSLPLGTQGLQAVGMLWEGELGDEFWAALIPQDGEVVSSTDFNARLDRVFHDKIHTLFRDQNAAGEYADFWRLVFYDFRKMHHFVFVNHLPETILELAGMDGADGDALINFLKNGRIPEHLAGGATRFRGVLGQSAKTPLLFLMRELRRIGVLTRDEFNPACMYMNAPARRVARRLGWIDEGDALGGDFGKMVEMSEKVHARLRLELPELAAYFDLPLQLYARKEFA